MKRDDLLGGLASAAAILFLVPAVVSSPASAATLRVSSVPIQSWQTSTGMPVVAPTPFVTRLAEQPHSDAPTTGDEGLDAPAAAGDQADSSQPAQAAVGQAPLEPHVDLRDCGDSAQYDGIVYGTAGDDVLIAGEGRQIIVGLGGDDVLVGGLGGDCLLGGRGEDRLTGGGGADVLVGGGGEDVLDAGADPRDTCVGTDAVDVLIGCAVPAEGAAGPPGESVGQAGDTEGAAVTSTGGDTQVAEPGSNAQPDEPVPDDDPASIEPPSTPTSPSVDATTPQTESPESPH